MYKDGVIFGKDNPKAKYLRSLHDRKKAASEGVVFVEGARLCEDTLLTGMIPKILFFNPGREDLAGEWIDRFGLKGKTEILCFSDELFQKITATVNPQGIAMVVPEPDLGADIPFRGKNDIYLCLEAMQDPGNLGTVIRLADAFDFTAVILVRGTADPFNEKVLRASMGSCWHIPLRKADSTDDVFTFCKEHGITTLAAHLKGDLLDEAKLDLPVCYFIGNEGNGLSDKCTMCCDKMIKIPMEGKAESLNAASAASIIGYVLSTKRK